MSSTKSERREVRYRGDVQGVGFRYTTRRIAAGYAVTGFVRNRSDGSVQLMVEGEPGELQAFLQAVAEAMNGNIREAVVQELPATGEFPDFTIRH